MMTVKKVPYLRSIFNIYLPTKTRRMKIKTENKRNEIVYESEINKIMLNKKNKQKCIRKRVMNDKKCVRHTRKKEMYVYVSSSELCLLL